MPLPHGGSWFGLPDFGVTEKLGQVFNRPTTAQDGSNIFGPQQSSYTPPASQPVYGPTRPAGPSRASNRGASASIPQATQQPYQQIQDQQNNGNSQIDSDYESAMSMLGGAESGLQSQAGTAQTQIEGEASQAKNEITNTLGVAEQGVNTSLQTAERQGVTAQQQARDLFRQTQQSNISQLSALGISSSSVSEALAERLGVETARRIAGVSGSLDDVRLNATNELGRIKTYYSGKIADVQNQVQVQKANIQQSLIQGLNQINTAKSQAASAKSQARANLLSQVQVQIGQLTAQQQQFEQSLQQWAAQKSAALQPIITDPQFMNTLTSATNNFNRNFAPSGFQYAPQVQTDAYGQVKGNVNYSLQKKPIDDLENPFATQ